MIKAIIFDFGGVLGSDSNAWKKNSRKILEVTGLSLDQIEEIGNSHWKQLNRGNKELSVLLNDICLRSKKDVDAATLEKIYEDNISINFDVLKFAENLKEQGFKIAILTNESRDGMEMKIQKFSLDKIFSRIYCSAFLGMEKPDKKIFEYVLQDLNMKGNELVFIDDREENIHSAAKLGIKSILFKNVNQLKKKLVKLEIF